MTDESDFTLRPPPQALPETTLLARYCAQHDCAPAEFETSVLRRCLAARARPLFFVQQRARLFTVDRELIRAVAAATTMDDVQDAIDEFRSNPVNYTWWRWVVGLRLSTLRLLRLANIYLPAPSRPPSRHPW